MPSHQNQRAAEKKNNKVQNNSTGCTNYKQWFTDPNSSGNLAAVFFSGRELPNPRASDQ
jgi:hypothetical protein